MRKEEIDELQREVQKNLGEKWEVKPMSVKKIGGDKEAIGCRFQGDTYLGELSKEQANGTGLEGCKMYAVTELDSIPDFYLYQECGTPIDDNTVDSEKIQWAYVQWIKVKAE